MKGFLLDFAILSLFLFDPFEPIFQNCCYPITNYQNLFGNWLQFIFRPPPQYQDTQTRAQNFVLVKIHEIRCHSSDITPPQFLICDNPSPTPTSSSQPIPVHVSMGFITETFCHARATLRIFC